MLLACETVTSVAKVAQKWHTPYYIGMCEVLSFEEKECLANWWASFLQDWTSRWGVNLAVPLIAQALAMGKSHDLILPR